MVAPLLFPVGAGRDLLTPSFCLFFLLSSSCLRLSFVSSPVHFLARLSLWLSPIRLFFVLPDNVWRGSRIQPVR